MLFVAAWDDIGPPRSEQPCVIRAEFGEAVGLVGFASGPFDKRGCLVSVPLWVGGAIPVPRGTMIVVYANSNGVYARTEIEFEALRAAVRCSTLR